MQKPILALDFGTSFLKAVLFFPEDLKILNILKIPYDPNSQFSVEERLGKIISFLEKKQKNWLAREGRPFFSILGIGENPGKGKIKTKTFLRKNPKKEIKPSEFEGFLKEIQKESFLETKDDFEEKKFLLVSAKIKKVKVDDWQVSNPLSLLGKTIFLKIINLYLKKDFYQSIRNVFSYFKIKPLCFCYIPDIFPSALNDFKSSGIFIDVGGKNTQIFLVTSELEIIKEIPIGGENFTYQSWEEKIISTISEFLSLKRNLPKDLYLFGGGSQFVARYHLIKLPFSFIIKRVTPLDLKNIRERIADNFQTTVPLAICSAVSSGQIEIAS